MYLHIIRRQSEKSSIFLRLFKIFLKKFLQQTKTAGSSAKGNTAGRQKHIF
ncbi:hypothetical protein HMPREF9443_01787 [Phascolarctobacterium succinatutens YIT 12067]|uniref:Uncharacterized protein n=1 Tax=Phascolarctobacterium succinatutens YIT 12067 TaxID=626939 RepID=E8LFZ3_9FIRM|nr:hypothetical protein HMPREF9443_01787 [Phascolarctobacterium succinatutens YIT 12067]